MLFKLLHTHLYEPICSFIYPRTCFVCQQLLKRNESRVCTACWSSIIPISAGEEVWEEIRGKFSSESVVSDFCSCFLFEKEGALQHIIHFLKYQGMASLGIQLGKEIGRRIITRPEFLNADYLIPIPLHKRKLRERGYNQSEYICKGIANITGIEVCQSLIVRKKDTISQTQLNIHERKQNVGDAFVIKPRHRSIVVGKKFILVDDVITTGSTINACATQLLRFNASNVLAASIALAK